MEDDGEWISIIEYSRLRKRSISTIRRDIKANRVKFRMESGKYFLFIHRDRISNLENKDLELLQKELKKLREENQDLRMLVDLYESGKKREVIFPPEIGAQ